MTTFPPFPATHAITHEPYSSDDIFLYQGNSMQNAIETMPRHLTNNSTGYPIQAAIFFTYFTAPINLTVNNIVVAIINPAVALTGGQIGLYTVNTTSGLNGPVTLAAYSTNSTTVFNNFGEAVIPLTTGAPYSMVAGARYAIGIIQPGGTTAAKFGGSFFTDTTAQRPPRISGLYNATSPTLLTSPTYPIADASITKYQFQLYAALIP